MLKIGQRVIVKGRPTKGRSRYRGRNSSGNTCIYGIVNIDDDVYYQIDGYSTHCLWCEENLQALYEYRYYDEPAFGLHDKLMTSTGVIKTVVAISRSTSGYQYVFDDLDEYDRVNLPGTYECYLTLHRKHTVNYTLF